MLVSEAAKKLGMRTESSARFEKGLDPENTLPAVQRACELVELLGAGEVVSGIIDERCEDVYKSIKENNLVIVNEIHENGWCAISLRKA